MNKEKKLFLITRNLEEILTEEELKKLIDKNKKLVHYIGFEISGLLHLGSGIVSMMKVKDFQEAGVECNIFLADWHSWINEKLGSDLNVIKSIGVRYYKEAFKICLDSLGGDSKNLNFITGSDLYHNADEYWLTVINIGKNTTLSRTLRSVDILGRKAGEGIDMAKLIYPLMQVADIFYLNVNLAHAGMDQRKAHVIARMVANNIKRIKPIALHHHIILGLQKPPKYPITEEELRELKVDLKMSKSKPETCIFIHDSPEEVERKIIKAFCPPSDIVYNPILDWIFWLILPLNQEINIKTVKGNTKKYKDCNKKELLIDYKNGIIHPMDLKEVLLNKLIEILKPINKRFKNAKEAEILQKFLSLQN